MMDHEEGVSGSFMIISNDNSDSLYPMFFGVSCAFLALKQIPEPEISDGKWSEIVAQTLLVWTVQRKLVHGELIHKLENAEREMRELKKRRSEDAKANERVVSIFAAREQSWCDERRKLRLQIGGLMNELRVAEVKREESVSELSEKVREIEVVLVLKDQLIEESDQRRLETDERLKNAEKVAEESRESESKHKAALDELEAGMGRCLGEVEETRQELDSVLEEKEQLVVVNQRMSMEIVRLHKELEQRDQMVSAMLMKSKLDAAEMRMLSKKVESSKAKVESARWKAVSETKHQRRSFRNMLSTTKHVNANSGLHPFKNCQVEIDAVVEQLRQRDEKLHAYAWRLMSTEMETKRLQSHIEALDHEIKNLKQDNIKLESMLIDREPQLHSLQDQSKLRPPNPLKLRMNSSKQDPMIVDDANYRTRATVGGRKPGQRRQETKGVAEVTCLDKDIVLTLESPNKEMSWPDHLGSKRSYNNINCTWKMDIHALGVSYKLRRLKQQLFMLESFTAKKENDAESSHASMHLLNKQVDHYKLLQGKLDDLCRKMHDNNMNLKHGGKSSIGTKGEDETKMKMEKFLEETFQLEKYIVATGQKLILVEAQDMEEYGESIKTLFRQVQRGLEVRMSRIIGDLEGTLTCNSLRTLRKG